MNYAQKYGQLIRAARIRGSGDENHHILPRCIGGGDETDNMVMLTFKEHYIAHLLLSKIHPYSSGLVMAYGMMSARSPTGACYAKMRRLFSAAASELVLDGWARKRGFGSYSNQCSMMFSEYIDGASVLELSVKYKLSQSCIWKSIWALAKTAGCEDVLLKERTRRKIETGKISRLNFTEEQEARRVAAVKSVDRTEYAARLSAERKGTGNPMFGRKRIPRIVECPHCNKTGAESQMKRWHMENCKGKIE